VPSPKANPRIRTHVVHEDAAVVVVNKMPGVVTEPGRSHRDDSLLNGLFAHEDGRFASRLARQGEARDWGLLHRLDRLTSGLILVALTSAAYDALRAAFESRDIRKTYLAVVRGELAQSSGEIEAPLIDERVGEHRFSAISTKGRPALTRYRTVERVGRYALLECDLVTGRLHQIRVHFASIGAPIAGDPVYEAGGRARPQGRRPQDAFLCLHAWKLAFRHPESNEAISAVGATPRRFDEFARDHGLTRVEAIQRGDVMKKGQREAGPLNS